MIKFYISYFYQIRHMKPNMLPVSTAMYDPKWFHENLTPDHIFMDSNHVLNGVRMNNLCMDLNRVNRLICDGEMCDETCSRDKATCDFMREYAECLRQKNPDFKKFISFCEGYVKFLNSWMRTKIDTIILIVHEPPTVKCGERPMLVEWFKENGLELEEFQP